MGQHTNYNNLTLFLKSDRFLELELFHKSNKLENYNSGDHDNNSCLSPTATLFRWAAKFMAESCFNTRLYMVLYLAARLDTLEKIYF